MFSVPERRQAQTRENQKYRNLRLPPLRHREQHPKLRIDLCTRINNPVPRSSVGFRVIPRLEQVLEAPNFGIEVWAIDGLEQVLCLLRKARDGLDVSNKSRIMGEALAHIVIPVTLRL